MTEMLTTPWHAGDEPANAGESAVSDLGFTDVDNSVRFAAFHGDRVRYVAVWKKWLTWEGHAWGIDDDNVRVFELAKDLSRNLYLQAADERDSDKAAKIAAWAKQSSSLQRISAMVKLARGIEGITIPHTDLDPDPWLFGVRNGVVELRIDHHRPGQPEDLVFRQAGTGYDRTTGCPTWERCMAQWFPDERTRRYLQCLAGSALVGEQKDHNFVVHFGGGGNGKSTFFRALANVFGDYYITPDKSLIVHQKHDKHDTERAALFGTRLAVAVETNTRQALNEAQIKNLTGGDRIHARRLYENPWEFAPSHSLWMQTNYLPEIHGRDAGIWRRIKVVPWVAKFEGAAQDIDLDAKLRSEAAGILNWLIEGCLEWQRSGLQESPQVVAATAQYRNTEDVLGRCADDTGLIFTNGLQITAKKLRDTLEMWCSDEGIHPSPSRKEVAEWLRSNGAEKIGRKQIAGESGTWWQKVGFVDNPGPAREDTAEPAQVAHVSETLHIEGVKEELRNPAQPVQPPPSRAARTADTATAPDLAAIPGASDATATQPNWETIHAVRELHKWNSYVFGRRPMPGQPGSELCRCGRRSAEGTNPPACRYRH
jgi:putative DNA primase/helicase